MDWTTGRLFGLIAARTFRAHLYGERAAKLQTKNQKLSDALDELEYDAAMAAIPCQDVHVKRTTISTRLAQASHQPERDWRDIVPKFYHCFCRVFSEEDCQRFPESRPWDHAIELLPFAPDSINCKVYPLPRPHQSSQDKFLNENLKKKYIQRSKARYASGFFFVDKKDNKL
jgi:hypothetical protein